MSKLWNTVRTFFQTHPHAFLAFYFVLYLILYSLVEHLVPSDGDYWVSWTPLDDKIPFLEGFVIPYSLWYPALAAVGLHTMLRDPPAFRRYMYTIMVGFTLSLLICLVFPNGQDLRPAVMPRDNLFTRILSGIYAADTNTNVLPSMHVVGCAAITAAVFDCRELHAWRWPFLLLGILICSSTVFIKQHSVLDVYAGLALSLPILLVVYHKRLGAWIKLKWKKKEKAAEVGG